MSNRTRIAGALVGLVFGFTICWSGMTSPSVIRGALLFQQSYLFLFMCSAMATATIGLAVLKRLDLRAVLTGAPIRWTAERIGRQHILGGFIFGLGWGVTDVCPGPVATQLGQGIAWSLLTATGVVAGVWTYLRRGNTETEPAAEPVAEERPVAVATRAPAPVGA